MTEIQATQTNGKKPPIFKTVYEAFLFFIKNFKHVLFVSWPMLIIPIIFTFFIVSINLAIRMGLLKPFTVHLAEGIIPLILFSVALIYLYLFAFAQIGWYRANLNGVSKDNFANPIKPNIFEMFFVLKSVWFYIVSAFIILLPTGLVFAVTNFAAMRTVSVLDVVDPLFLFGPTVITFILLSIFCLRMHFCFADIVTEKDDPSFMDSVRKFSGLTIRFVTSLVIASLAIYILSEISAALLNFTRTFLGETVFSVLNLVIFFPISYFLWSLLLPFTFISILCTFYKWREDNPFVEEFYSSEKPTDPHLKAASMNSEI